MNISLPSVQQVHTSAHLTLQPCTSPQCLGCRRCGWISQAHFLPAAVVRDSVHLCCSSKFSHFINETFWCYCFQQHRGQLEGVSSLHRRLIIFSPEKKQPKQKIQWYSSGSLLQQISSTDLEVTSFRALDYFSHLWVCRLHKSKSQSKQQRMIWQHMQFLLTPCLY